MKVLGLICALSLLEFSVQAQVIYVDADAGGMNNGTSWTNAYTDLQDALATATSGDEVWIAEGVYKPTATTDRTISFVLIDGVALYGGFSGTETIRDERDWTLYESILSGEIGVPDDSLDNSYHVVRADGVSNSTILDGVRIEFGQAQSATEPDDRGGGLLALNGSPIVRNTTFYRNTAWGVVGQGGEGLGGSVFVDESEAHFENCTFYENRSIAGFGIYVSELTSNVAVDSSDFLSNSGNGSGTVFLSGGQLTITSSSFEQNINNVVVNLSGQLSIEDSIFESNMTFANGCAIYVDDGTLNVADSAFDSNWSGMEGGAIALRHASSVIVTNSSFTNNHAQAASGGAIWSFESDFAIIDSDFVRNTAIGSGGAVLAFSSPTSVVNSLFFGNVANSAGSGAALNLAGDVGPSLVANSVFVGNYGNFGGGLQAIAAGSGDVQIVNTTLAANTAGVQGGGMHVFDSNNVSLSNVVFWNNGAPTGPEIHTGSGTGPTVERAIVEGGYAMGTAILDSDPVFVRNPDPGPDMTWGTEDDDYGDLRLRDSSPALDYGLSRFLPPDTWDLDGDNDTTEPLPIDLNGDPRVQMTEVDLGAYEGPVSVSNETIDVPQSEQRLRVYPNPATDIITIESDSEEVEILDVLGRVILTVASSDRVDVSKLPLGTYLIKAGHQSHVLTIVR